MDLTSLTAGCNVPPLLPDRRAVIEALKGVPADASSVRSALEALDLQTA